MVELSPSRVVMRQEERRLWSASRISHEDSWRDERRGEEKGKKREKGGCMEEKQLLDLPPSHPLSFFSPLYPHSFHLPLPFLPLLFPLSFLTSRIPKMVSSWSSLNSMVALTCRKQLIALSLKEKPRHLASAINKHMFDDARQKEDVAVTRINPTAVA